MSDARGIAAAQLIGSLCHLAQHGLVPPYMRKSVAESLERCLATYDPENREICAASDALTLAALREAE